MSQWPVVSSSPIGAPNSDSARWEPNTRSRRIGVRRSEGLSGTPEFSEHTYGSGFMPRTASKAAARLHFKPFVGNWWFMNKRFAAFLLLPGLWLCLPMFVAGVEAKPEAIAQGKALLWLELVDTNKYDES